MTSKRMIYAGIVLIALIAVTGGIYAFQVSQMGDDLPKTFVVGYTNDIRHLDPHLRQNVWSILVINQMYEPLFKYKYEPVSDEPWANFSVLGEYEGVLATSWENPNDTTYIFHLREGVKFHDGSPLDANAVKLSLDRMRELSPKEVTATSIASVDVIDSHTVQIKLAKPFAPWFSMMAANYFGYIVSPKAIQENGDEYMKEHAVGTGPFKFVERTPGTEIMLERNEDYWGDAPKIDNIRYKIVPDVDTMRLEIEKGTIHYTMYFLPNDWLGDFKSNPNINTMQYSPSDIYRAIHFMHSVPPFDDVNVRKAIAYSLDYDSMLQALGPVYRVWTPLTEFYGDFVNKDVTRYERDLDKARELLVKSGYEDGLKITLHYSPFQPEIKTTAEIAQQNLKDVGIELELKSYEWATMRSMVMDKSAGMFIWGGGGGYPDPDNPMFANFHSSQIPARNRSDYVNPEVDSLLERARSSTDKAERIRLYYQVQEIVQEDLLYVPIWGDAGYATARKEITGLDVGPSRGFQIFSNVEITAEISNK